MGFINRKQLISVMGLERIAAQYETNVADRDFFKIFFSGKQLINVIDVERVDGRSAEQKQT